MSSCHLCKEDYDEVKSRLSMRQVAERYGRKILRNNTCTCPFHNDTRPSMKLYDKSFYCWSCGAGGDLISYVAKMHGISNEDACRQLMHDFGLPEPNQQSSYKDKRERELRQKKIQDKKSFLQYAKTILTVYHNLLAEASWNIADKHFQEAMQELDYVEYRLDCLKEHPDEFYRDKQAVKRIGSIRNRIINWYG